MGLVTNPGPGNAALRADRVAWPDDAAVAPEPILVEDELREERRQARAAQRQQWVQTAVLAGYAAVVAVGIAFHEPWADEAQAWLLARDNSFWHLMLHALRYEGSPGLWHVLLWVLVRMHVGYVGMRWVAGALAMAGVYVLLRWSPFPLVLKILLPFGFWLAYQDAAVARSYVVFAVLAFPAAAILRSMSRNELPSQTRLIWLAVLLGLLANLSVHGFIVSIGLAIVALVLLRRKARAGMTIRKKIPAVILACFWLFVAVTAFPPSDVDFPAGRNLQMSTQKVWAAFGSQNAKAELQQPEEGTQPLPGELPMLPAHVFQKTPGQARWHKIARVLGLLTFPVSNFRFLALAACALVIVQALVFGRARGQIGWIGLLPWALMVVTFSSMYLAPRHAGMIWEALIAALWLTWPAEPSSKWFEVWLPRLTLAVLVLVGLNQIQWTAHALRDEIEKPYSGDEAMAHWLQGNGAGKRIAGFGYHSIGVTGWFHGPLYFNQSAAYWVWSQKPHVDARAPFTIATHPDIIIVSGWIWNDRNADVSEDWVQPNLATLHSVPLNDAYHILDYAEAHGYRETHRFCGHAFMRSGYSEELCQVTLQPVALEPAAPQPVAPAPPQ
jgi:hypothetical protein